MMFKNYFSLCLFMIGLFSNVGCKAEMSSVVTNGQEKMLYFASFSDYSLPLKLVEEITRDDALSREAYYLGFYDEVGRLYRVEKYFKGALFFKHDYFYHENGQLKESKVVNYEGIEKVNLFNEHGKPLK